MTNIRLDFKFIIIFIVVLILKIAHGGYIINFLCNLQLTILLVSFLNIVMNYLCVGLDVKFSNQVYKVKNIFEINITVKNRGVFPINFVTVENTTINGFAKKYNGETLSVGSFSKKDLKYSCVLKERGIYNLCNYQLEISDLFSIITVKKNIKKHCMLKVYPRYIELNKKIYRGTDSFEDEKSIMGYREAMYSIKDIRKYEPGDSLKKINWKISAKANELMVKNYDSIAGTELNIFLNMNRSNYTMDADGELEELLIDLTYSIIKYSNENNRTVKLWCNNYEGTHNVFDYENYEDVFEFFVEKKSDGNISFEDFIKVSLPNIPRGSTLIFITGIKNEELNRIEQYVESIDYIPKIICLKSESGNCDSEFYLVEDLVEGVR